MSLDAVAIVLTGVSAVFSYMDKRMPESAIRKFNDWLRQAGEEVLEGVGNVSPWQFTVLTIVSWILAVLLINTYPDSEISITLFKLLNQPMDLRSKFFIIIMPLFFIVMVIASLVVMATYFPGGVWALLGASLWVAELAVGLLMEMS